MAKLPSFQFYPGDWQKDAGLRRCSHAAKGVWIDMLCLMFECDERGTLATSGISWSDKDIAQAVGGDQAVTLLCIQELVDKGVARRNSFGALYCRRMVMDENKRRLCSLAGKNGGGNPNLSQTFKGSSKGRFKGDPKGSPKQNPNPSSSTSVNIISSSEENNIIKMNILTDIPKKSSQENLISEVVGKWNEFSFKTNLAQVRELTPKRIAGIKARLSEKNFDLENLFREISCSEFLLGGNKDGWKVTFDFVFLSPNNWVKIVEGNYRKKEKKEEFRETYEKTIERRRLRSSAVN